MLLEQILPSLLWGSVRSHFNYMLWVIIGKIVNGYFNQDLTTISLHYYRFFLKCRLAFFFIQFVFAFYIYMKIQSN